MTAQSDITVGQMLIYRSEFEAVSQDPHQTVKVRGRAAKMMQVLDEIIERRRADVEAANG